MSETIAPAPAADAAAAAPANDGFTPVSGPLTPATSILGNAQAPAEPAAPAADPAVDPAKPAEPDKPAEPAAVEYKDLKVPETIDAANPALTAFTAEAAKLGVPQDKAEALLAQVAPKLAEQLSEPYRAWTRTQEEWQAAIKADPEIGGDNFAKMQTTIAKALDNPKITDPGMRDALIMTGAGNSPAMVRTLYRWASQLTEGSHVSGQPAAQRASLAEQMYPSMVKAPE